MRVENKYARLTSNPRQGLASVDIIYRTQTITVKETFTRAQHTATGIISGSKAPRLMAGSPSMTITHRGNTIIVEGPKKKFRKLPKNHRKQEH